MVDDDPTTDVPKRPRPRRKAAVKALATMPAEVIEPSASSGGGQVEIRRRAVGRIDSARISVEQGAIGAVRADHLSVDRGAVGAVMADQVEVSRGYARSILARQVQLDRGAARIVIAADVHARQSTAMFLVARRVSGDMRVLFDWRGALAFGAAAGLVFAVLAKVRRKPR